ncbi:haloalkane dehalogenase [Nocardia sp. NPDC058058]|uniref:haloalkane dehalogenase n=1 Tax=Nocardia sp. NPDC058058 TaxID=3346317 RepID=UPI0036D94469
MSKIDVLDSHIAYTDVGAGAPVVFLHGNPTSSYMWRNVIPHLSGEMRCLAPDLIGMGDSGKPDVDYRYDDHMRYLDAWFEALDLSDIVIVGHDWGAPLGVDWARRHPDRVRAIALLQPVLRPLTWPELGPVAELFAKFRGPEGERLILQDNVFIEGTLRSTTPSLTESDMAIYRAPYPDPESRRPLLAWPRELPIDGEPADVVDHVLTNGKWLGTTPEVPKLLLHVDDEPGIAIPPAARAWIVDNVAAVELVAVGPGGHHSPEDQPDTIGRALVSWLRDNNFGFTSR